MPEIQDAQVLEQLLEECQVVLRYHFRDRQMLVHCLTHASAARSRLWSNERLEFLGDSVLGTVVCEALYLRYPDADEGEMTRVKSIVVSRVTCAAMALRIELDRFVLTGKGIGGISGRIPMSILAGTFESLIASIYFDGGLDAARSFLIPLVMPEIEQASASLHAQNYKSLLQHIGQKTYGATPIYQLLDESGPDHSKRFHVGAVIAGREFPSAWGANKKDAEQAAAQNAIQELLAPPVVDTVSTEAEAISEPETIAVVIPTESDTLPQEPPMPVEEFGVFLESADSVQSEECREQSEE